MLTWCWRSPPTKKASWDKKMAHHNIISAEINVAFWFKDVTCLKRRLLNFFFHMEFCTLILAVSIGLLSLNFIRHIFSCIFTYRNCSSKCSLQPVVLSQFFFYSWRVVNHPVSSTFFLRSVLRNFRFILVVHFLNWEVLCFSLQGDLVKRLSWDRENLFCPKVTKMGSTISHRMD